MRFLVFAVALAALTLGAADRPKSKGTPVTEVTGRVKAVNAENGWWGIVRDDDPGTRYAPKNLPPELRKDGQRVKFSGVVTEPSSSERRWGTPIELTKVDPIPPE